MADILDRVLGSRARVRILRVLFRRPEVTGREAGRLAGLSPRAAHLALAALAREGVVHRRRVGNAMTFAVDADRHIVSRGGLAALFADERRLADVMAGWAARRLEGAAVLSLALYGSFARGEEEAASDFDLALVARSGRDVPAIRERAAGLESAFQRLFGHALSPYVVSRDEFAERHRRGDPLVAGIVAQGRVVAGKAFTELLAGGR